MTILVISDPGSYIGKQKDQFKISFGMANKPISYIPAVKVRGILIDTSVTISSGGFQLIRKNGIFVIWQDIGDDGMILQPFNSHGSVEVRRAQYSSLDDIRGVIISSKITYAACRNKITVLKRLRRHINSDILSEEVVAMSLTFMEEKLRELTQNEQTYTSMDLELRQYLMNIEAQITKKYYVVLTQFLNFFDWDFEKRSRRPAQDAFNALLNYSYAILRGTMTQNLAISGLDNYAGFLHTDRSGRKSLVLDMIEEFRQVAVDEPLLQLVAAGQIIPDDFDQDGNGIVITSEIKETLFPAILERQQTIIRQATLQRWQIDQSRKLAGYLRGLNSDYYPFLLQVSDPWG